MSRTLIIKAFTTAILAILVCVPANARSPICFQGEFEPNKALILVWGDTALSKTSAMWDLPTFVATRPNKKEMIKDSLMGDIDVNLVISHPDKTLNAMADGSTTILLAKTAPYRKSGEPSYACSACAVLLGAQLWSLQGSKWCLEAEDRAIRLMGGIGELSYDNVEVVKVGPKKWGVLFEDDVGRGGTNPIETTLLLPSGGGFIVAFREITGDGYQGDETSYFRYTAKIDFIPGQNVDYFDLRVVTSGTNRDKRDRSIPWNREKTYIMNNGRYVLKTDRPIVIKQRIKK